MSFKNKVEVKQFEFVTPVNTPDIIVDMISTDPTKPTVVTKITFDCLKPGDRIWLNSIFHLTNNTGPNFEPIIDHKILKNNEQIYTAKTEIDTPGDDSEGQIFLQETVDVIDSLEINVTYQVVVSASTEGGIASDVSLLGPIAFTGTLLDDGKDGFSFQKLEVKQFEFSPPVKTDDPIVDMISTDFDNPTVVTKITFDCLKPGDRIWLNSIFHLTNNADDEPIIDHRILKNNVSIYTARTEIDGGVARDSIGQIFSQQYVDVIDSLEKNVTYQVVVSASTEGGITSDVSLLGPIEFTGTRYVDGKKGLPLNKVEIKQFEFVTPEKEPTEVTEIGNSTNPTAVAKVTFDCLKPGDRVWLNSIFHLTNNQDNNLLIVHAILKNNEQIYTAKTEIDTQGDDSEGQIFSQETVDVIDSLEKNVTYQVIVSTPSINGTDVFLFGPITFTGTRYVVRKKGFG
ncbi:hypothetical protein [Chengkuizengella sediminis]|uniref:hypothetical protein n=1 Tax=Chengkuizengella sediminis TaxID=1885917 RepID=UPI0013896011|nr:hypothetical protein [Chengkuizengella sediminis]NDI35696.1 hypothetical protein [Chengkuizengella sediminis]